MTYSEAGKGSMQRPTDAQRYAAQYDKIFGKKQQPAPLTPTPIVTPKINAKNA